MAKRDHSFLGEDNEEGIAEVEITNGMIKGYHEFGIKLPIGCRVVVERESCHDARDEYALLCKVPQDLDYDTLEVVMRSKSKRKEYKVRDVVGKPIGRVQYFLNKSFSQLLEEGKVESVHGCITGEARASLKPTASQKWHKNRQAGGGAILPCSWILRVPRDMMDRVVEVVKARLPDVEGHEIMEVKVLQSTKKVKKE